MEKFDILKTRALSNQARPLCNQVGILLLTPALISTSPPEDHDIFQEGPIVQAALDVGIQEWDEQAWKRHNLMRPSCA